MTKISGALGEVGKAFTEVAPAASILARTGKAWSDSSTARDNLDSVRSQVSVERSLAEARADRDEADRTRRLQASMSSQIALSAGRGIDLGSLDGVAAGNKQQFDRDMRGSNLNRMAAFTKLDFMENDAARTANSSVRNSWLNAAVGNAETMFYRRETPTKRA